MQNTVSCAFGFVTITYIFSSEDEVFDGYFRWKNKWETVTGKTGEKMLIARPLNEEKLKSDLQSLKDKGINAVAVVLMHSYT